MTKLTITTTIILAIVILSCRTTHDNSKNSIVDKEKIKTEIIQAETALLTAYRQGEFMKALSMEVNSPDFRSIINGKISNYETLEARYKKVALEKNMKSVDYKVESRDFNFINANNVLVTLIANSTTTMSDGNILTKGPTAETILWQRINNSWQLGYYHASDLAKGN
jgi:hypothetical protein